MRARLVKEFTFEAAQTLPRAPEGHKCRLMHGHSFKVEIHVEGEVDAATGWVYDHAEISRAMKPLLERLVSGSQAHAARRVDEMSAAAAYLDELGVTPWVARAAADRLAALRDDPA